MTTQPEPISTDSQIIELTARLLATEIDGPLFDSLVAAQRELDKGDTGASLALLDRELFELGRDRALEELAVEYARLFVGPQPACPPYASVHHRDALLGGRRAREVEATLVKLGISTPGWRIATSDHLAVELHILSVIEARRAQGHIDEPTRNEFVRSTVLPWASGYLRHLAASARFAPYSIVPKAAAQVLEGWKDSADRPNRLGF